MKNQTVKITPKQLKTICKFFLNRNMDLQKEGKKPLSVVFESEAGIGKTSSIIQVADEMEIPISVLVLSQLDDLGDLVGFPMKTHKMKKGGLEKWFDEGHAKTAEAMGWEYIGDTRTDYAEPKWVNNLRNSEQSILLIDDFTRADQRFNQAVMQLIQMGSYYGWDLPKGCTILLSSNPEDGDYFVSAQDQAMTTRYFKFEVRFDIDDYAEYAERIGTDGRCINYMLRYWDQVIPAKDSKQKQKGKLETNPRQWDMFFNAIGGFEDFSSPESLSQIQMIGGAIVGEHVSTFTTFINNRLDKLPEPRKMLLDKNTKEVLNEIRRAVGDIKSQDPKKMYRPEIASILATRFANFTINHVEDKPLTDELCDRLEIICKENVFGDDLNFKIYRDAFGTDRQKFRKLITREFFVNYIV